MEGPEIPLVSGAAWPQSCSRAAEEMGQGGSSSAGLNWSFLVCCQHRAHRTANSTVPRLALPDVPRRTKRGNGEGKQSLLDRTSSC